jgi:hypothetical protein
VAPSPIRGRPKRRDDVVHALSYYDGARRLGSILERNRIATAFDVDGKRLGTFRTRREACRERGLPVADLSTAIRTWSEHRARTMIRAILKRSRRAQRSSDSAG